MKELTKIQRQAAVWILDAFKSTPTGVVESLASLILIHLQIWKLVYHNHICMHTLADSHITHLMAATRNEADFISVYHPFRLRNKCKSPPSGHVGQRKLGRHVCPTLQQVQYAWIPSYRYMPRMHYPRHCSDPRQNCQRQS